MTKIELQKELKEKVKPGIKPSQLKRSKSLSDIPKAPVLPKSTPLTKSKSAQELEPTNSKIEQLESKISVLELKLETSQRELIEKDIEKQDLQKQLEAKGSIKEFDQSLTKRHQNLKDWFSQYQKTKQLDSELTENIEQASSELINQDNQISQLRAENSKLKQTNSQLSQDLKLAQRLVDLRSNGSSFNNERQLRKTNSLTSEDNWLPFPSFSWITLALTALALWFLMKPNYD